VDVLGNGYDPAVQRHPTRNAPFNGVPESRLVFARSSDDTIAYLEDGSAQHFKDRRAAGESFSCLVPNCDSPMLTVVARSERRDGFAHLSSGGHGGVGVAHLQSQLLLQRWLTTRYPSLQVELEMTTEDGSRRADVMAISPVTGARIAFEVQYAGMTADEWTERHLSYQSQDIVDIWLWGYGGEHARPEPTDTQSIRGSQTLATVAAHGSTILFIDPEWEYIGYASREPYPFHLPGVRALSTNGYGRLHSEPLDSFRLNADRQFVSSELEILLVAPAKIGALLEAREREQERERAEKRARDQERQEAKEAFLQRVDQKAAVAERAWGTSPACARLTARFGTIPEVLNHVPAAGDTVIRLPVPPVVWQSDFYLRHIHGRANGSRVSIRTMTSELEQMDRDVRFPEEAVRSWLSVLHEAGILDKVPSPYRRDRWPKYVVARSIAPSQPE
jgi:hypothetical protein